MTDILKLKIKDIDYSPYIIEEPKTSIAFEDYRIIGNAPSMSLDLTLNNQDGVFDSLIDEDFVLFDFDTGNQFGIFNVIEKPERMTGTLSLTLYDKMVLTNIAYETNTAMYPCTIKNQLDEMSTLTGLSINYSVLPADILSQAVNWYDNTVIIRDYLCWIAELAACNILCNATGGLEFIQLSKTATKKIPLDSVEEFDKIDQYVCNRICFDDGVNFDSVGDESANTLYLSNDNSYITDESKGNKTLHERIAYIYSVIGKISFSTVDGLKTVENKEIRVGDIVDFGGLFNFIALNIEHSHLSGEYGIQVIGGDLKIKNAEIVTTHVSNATRIKRLTTRVDQDEVKMEIMANVQDEYGKRIGTLEVSSEQIVSKVEKVDKKVDDINAKKMYRAAIVKSGSTLTEDASSIELLCSLYEWDQDVTADRPAISFNWKRSSGDTVGDAIWNEAHKGKKSILLTPDDVYESASFGCEVNTAAGLLIKTSYETIIDETDLVMPSVVMYSDMPLIQQYNPEEKTYHPDWSKMNVFPIIRLNGTELDLKDSRITISYKRKDGAAKETDLIAGEIVKDGVLTISKNMLATSNSKIITYIGYVEYLSKTIHDSITFTLVQDGEKGIDGSDGKDAAERYTWIAYADNAQGGGMSSSPDGKKYLGVAYNKTVKTPGTNPADYSWSLIKGSDGIDGTNGKDGKDAAIQVDSEPSDKSMMWCDTSANPPVLKRWDGSTWVVVNDYNDQIVNTKQQITEEYNSAIQQTKESITQSVEKVKTITDEQSKIISGLKNTIELTEEQTSFIKTTVEQLETVVDGKVDTNTIQEWARFNGSTLELGASNSIFKAILTNTELGFYQSGTKVAWISNNELKILKASVEQYLTIGKSRIEWSDTTGFTIRW